MVLESASVPATTEEVTDEDARLLLEEAFLQAVELLEERRVESDEARKAHLDTTEQADANRSAISEAPLGYEWQQACAVETESSLANFEEPTSIGPLQGRGEAIDIDSDLNVARPGEPDAAPIDCRPDLNGIAEDSGEDAFRGISDAFDDQSSDVRNSAARALFNLNSDRAASFTRALREGSPSRRHRIGQALAASGLAIEAIGNLTGESREKTYDAFSLLFLMAKAGELQPLLQAIEEYPQIEERLAVVKLLALSGQVEIIPAFRRLAVRGALPSEVRSAIVEALYQISSQTLQTALPGARSEILSPSKVVIRG